MAEVIKVNREKPEPAVIARAAEMIRKGEAVAIPTDTLYGLAANPFDAAAVERIFAIKGRAKHIPLLLLVGSVEMARELAGDLPAGFERLAERFWPGPLTIVVEAAARVPAAVTGGTGRIGLRVPQAAIVAAIVKQTRAPIIGTSANRTGEKECVTAQEVERQIGTSVRLILDGGASGATRASTVIDVHPDSWKMLREGVIEAREIERLLGEAGETDVAEN